MNLEHQRCRFLKNGVFLSKAMWVNFLARLTANRLLNEDDEEDEDDEDEEQKLNAIWYTLREGPAFINS